MKPIVFLDAAESELLDAKAFYEAQVAGLGDQFHHFIQAALEKIQRNPKGLQRYRTSKYRFCIVRRFPYVLHFHELRDRIRIVAVAHGSRRPGYWRRRDVNESN